MLQILDLYTKKLNRESEEKIEKKKSHYKVLGSVSTLIMR